MIIGNNDRISVDGSTFKLAAFNCALGNVAPQEVDLSPYQGQMVRVYLDGNLRLRINPSEDMYWQLAEMFIPAQQRAIEKEPDMASEALPLDLAGITIKVFEKQV